MELNAKNAKKSTFKAQFNELKINEQDPTILKGTIIIHDFEKSWNNQVITEEICNENMNTLIGKRIVCKYIPAENNNGVDSLADHENRIGKDRNGNEIIITNTIAIGFIEGVYIDDYTDENGITKKVLFGNVVIWNDDKYANIVGLLQEWIERGIKIHMSVEYLYCNYNVVEGIEYLQSPILYVAHTFLNSEQRGEYAEILPAYDCATLISLNEKQQWNKAINQLSKNNINDKQLNNSNKLDNKSNLNKNNKNSKKEECDNMDNVFLKSMNGISFGDVRDKLYTELSKVMLASEYEWVWISMYNIFDDYFVYETRIEEKWVTFKIPYTKTEEGEVSIAYDQKAEVTFSIEWTEVQNSLNVKDKELSKANEEIADLKKQLNEKEEVIKSSNSKESVSIEKFNELTETIVSLNTKVKELQPLAEGYKKAEYEKALNSAKDFYKEKFENIDCLDIFEKEETQKLIEKSINEVKEEADKAKFDLNNLIIDNLKSENKPEISLNSVQPLKDNKNLTKDIVDEFEERYGFKRD